MKNSTSTKVIEKLIDLELISKLNADLARYKREQEKKGMQGQQAA